MVSELERRYARAFVNIYSQIFSDTFFGKLDELVAFLKGNKNAFFYLKISSIPLQVKHDVLMRVITDYGLASELKPLVILLVRHKRLEHIASILESISSQGKERCGLVEACVSSFPELSLDQIAAVRVFLEKKLSKKVRLNALVDKSLIAGIRVSGETFLFERSIAQHVRRIAHGS